MVDRSFEHSYSHVLSQLRCRLEEAPPGRIQLLSGPRQVGKTHLLHQLAAEQRHPVVFAAADSAPAAVPGWWEAQWRAAETSARGGPAAVLMIDEIQHLPDWAARLKAEYDRLVRERLPIHVIVTGSSSLTLGRGARESMAGRFEHLRLLHWPPSELVTQLALDPDDVVELAITRGTYPGAVRFLDDAPRWQAYVREAIIEPAIGRDILALERVRKPALLRQVFGISAAHPGEIISLQKLRGQLDDRGALETIAHYLELLEQAYLVAAVPKYSGSTVRQRAAPPKLTPLNQGIVAAMTPTPVGPGDPAQPARGRWVENACTALAWNAGQQAGYWRREPLEVDLVTSGSWGLWAIEVKTGTYEARDLAGLLELCRLDRDHRPLVVCDPGAEPIARAAGVEAISWHDFLIGGPPP
jgi:uncharacterized protein